MVFMTIRAVPLLVLLAARAAADPCPPLDPTSVPPIPRKPASKASLARSNALLKAPDTDCEGYSALARLREAIRVEPANVDARVELVHAIDEAVRDRPDAALAALQATLLVQLRDAAWAGEADAISLFMDPRHRPDAWQGPAANAFYTSIENGPPGKLGDATRAVLRWLLDDGADADVARYFDHRPIRIEEGFNGSGADVPEESTSRKTVKGQLGLKRWRDQLADHGDLPGRGDSTWCSGHCCRMPFIDYHPHMHRVSALCFDAKLHVRLLATESSGM
jgi:hypothetical protein